MRNREGKRTKRRPKKRWKDAADKRKMLGVLGRKSFAVNTESWTGRIEGKEGNRRKTRNKK